MDTDIRHYTKALPQYQQPLSFVQSLLDFQADLADKVESSFHIEPDVARDKWQAGKPLFADEPVPTPPAFFQAALVDLRSLLPPGAMAQMTLDRLLAADVSECLRCEELIADRGACIRRLAEATATDAETVAFVLGAVLSPFFEKQAVPYREWLAAAAWRRGICPVCGSQPWMARLSGDSGRRSLACSLCHTEWVFERLRCPFCDNTDQAQLRYFTVNGDTVHRVDCCGRCRRYIKTVDERASVGPANLLLEDVVTAHLDALALQQGYR